MQLEGKRDKGFSGKETGVEASREWVGDWNAILTRRTHKRQPREVLGRKVVFSARRLTPLQKRKI